MTFDGHDDHIGESVRYIQDIEVKVPAPQFRMVKREYDRLKLQMKEEGMDVIGFARNVPFAASTLELGLPVNEKDVVMDGPFDRPDEYYLNKQRKAFGFSDTSIDDKDTLLN